MTSVFDEVYTNMGITSVNFGNSETEKQDGVENYWGGGGGSQNIN